MAKTPAEPKQKKERNPTTVMGKSPAEPKKKEEPELTTAMAKTPAEPKQKKEHDQTTVVSKTLAEPKKKQEHEPTNVMAKTPAEPASWAAVVAENLKPGTRISPPQRPVVCSPSKPRTHAAPKLHAKPRAQAKHAHRSNCRDQPKRDNTKSAPVKANEIFVGNIPLSIGTGELKQFFNKFANVVQVMIKRKQGRNKNFGFVEFESDAAVKKVLSMRPILLSDEVCLVVDKTKQRGDHGPGTRVGPHSGGEMKEDGCQRS